jgi:PKD repeat protein
MMSFFMAFMFAAKIDNVAQNDMKKKRILSTFTPGKSTENFIFFMKRIVLSLFILAALVITGKAQGTAAVQNDTAKTPYWVQMMQDPGANFFQTQRAFDLYWEGRPVTKGSGWKVFKRWEYMTRLRINPDGSIPSQTRIYDEMARYNSKTRSANGNWTSLGPSTIPLPGPAGYEGLGRLNVVAFHPTDPNKIYAGSPSGGMWQSTDGGATWTTYTDTLPTLGVSSIIVDYSNASRILIGTGDRDAGDAPGLGVFLSTNGGLTWTQSNTGMGNRVVGEMIQHPTNALFILAATSGGVYRSSDGGANWTQSQSGDFKDIVFKPGDPNTVYAAAGSDFYKSTNGGTSFTKITSGLTAGQRGTIAVSAANPNYVYFLQSNNSSGFKGVYRSTNSGTDFTTRSTTPNILDWSCAGGDSGGQGWYDLAFAADPLNAETIYVGGVNVWKSTNGGTTWSINSHWYGGCSVPAVHADCHILTYSPVNGKLYAGNDGGIWSTSNGGAAWTDHTEGMTIGQIYKLGTSQTVREKTINGFQDNGTYTYIGTDWLATGGGDGMECAVDFSNAAYTYHTIYYGDIYRKTNNNYEKHIAGNGIFGITESGAWVTPFILNKADAKGMFVGYKNIWRCSDVSKTNLTWEKISDNLAGSNGTDMCDLEQSTADPNILYASRYDNRFFRTDNCLGATPAWADLTTFKPTNNLITDITTHPTDPNTLYITAGNSVYKSTDKGLTWTDLTDNLPDIHLNAIVYYNNSNEGLYVGSESGVYYRDPTTSGWISFNEGMPHSARVTELDIYYDNDSVSRDALRASTYGRGLWNSDFYQAQPDADFAADHVTVPVGCSVNFTDLSIGVPTSWTWTFEGGLPATSSQKNPQNIVYSNPGVFFVKMVCANEVGSDSVTKLAYITASSTMVPQVDFTSDQQVLCGGNDVQFTDLSENCPSAWTWEFIPNTVSFVAGTNLHSQNPFVSFNQPGPYDAKLTVTNTVGSASLTKEDYIVNGGYPAPFSENFEQGLGERSWTIVNPDLSKTWDTITVPNGGTGTKAVWMNFYDYITVTRRDQLISPAIDLSNVSSATLSFRHAYAQRSSLKDSLVVFLSDDCGTTWQRLLNLGPDGTPDILVTHENMMDPFFPESAADWCSGAYGVSCYTVDLDEWAGNSGIKIMFESYNRRGNNLFLDDIEVAGPVGIDDSKVHSADLRVYPNPTDRLVNVVLRHASQEATWQLISPQGQTITTGKLTGDTDRKTSVIDLDGNRRGLYFIKVVTGQATLIEKVVLQ